MATGTIIALRTDRGFGFIRGDEPGDKNENLFFHQTAVVADRFATLHEGDPVTFEVVPDPRNAQRFRAINVAAGSTAIED